MFVPEPGMELTVRNAEPLVRVAELQRVAKAVLFADVSDSVRLVEADEDNVIRLWLSLVEQVKSEVLPFNRGRLVKTFGDGMLMEFDDVTDAVRTAFFILDVIERNAAQAERERRIHMRMGLDLGEVLRVDDSDLYGRHVNIAARLLGLAQPGEIIASAAVRDELAQEVDAEFEDMGECRLRNIRQPVHAYRVHRKGSVDRIMPILSESDLFPTIAVVPYTPRNRDEDHLSLGEVLAEDLIVSLSRSRELNVISRLSTTGFRMRGASLDEIATALSADYVLSGTYSGDTEHVILDVELAEARSGHVMWARRISENVTALLADTTLIDAIAAEVHSAIRMASIRRATSNPMASLEGHTLLIGAVALMHRLSPRDFNLARELLETLIERSPNEPTPRAWMARWHVLRVQQGWSESPHHEGMLALQNTRRALDIDPTNVPALVAEGFVLTNLMHRLDEASDRYDAALDYNPNDANGRLLRGTLNAFRDRGREAVRDTERALHLAPLDPNRYFFLALAASACISAGDCQRALELADRSLRANRAHTSTLRVKAVAQMRLGDPDGARKTVTQLLELQPGLTIGRWLEGSPSAQYRVGQEFAETLREAGVPQ
jgi:class 3 adenylate cyclase/TolB-like protein